MPRIRFLLPAFLALTLVSAQVQAKPALPADYLRVPLVSQATDYSCGAASLLAVLYYWKVFDGDESDLYASLETTEKDGTAPNKILDVAKSYGLDAWMGENLTLADLRSALERGDTPIVDVQAWVDDTEPSLSQLPWKDRWEDGHYIVLIGMDRNDAYFMDPSAHGAYGYIPLREFSARWHDYENRYGPVWRFQHLAVVIHGATVYNPDKLIRIR